MRVDSATTAAAAGVAEQTDSKRITVLRLYIRDGSHFRVTAAAGVDPYRERTRPARSIGVSVAGSLDSRVMSRP
jgi:hypothetical protein